MNNEITLNPVSDFLLTLDLILEVLWVIYHVPFIIIIDGIV